MATLTADKVRAFEEGTFNEVPVAASTTIFEGCAVGSNAGYARKLVALDKFLGFAVRKVDNSAGAAGDKRVTVRRCGLVEAPVVGASVASIGLPVYMSDDDVLTLTSTSNSKIGFVARHVNSTTCVVYFDAILANYA